MSHRRNNSLNARRPHRAVSTLHEWTGCEDISDRLFNPRVNTTGPPVPTTGAENSTAREGPERPMSATDVLSSIATNTASSLDEAGSNTRKWRPQILRPEQAGNFSSAYDETNFPSEDASSLLSWTTASTAPTVSELSCSELIPIQGTAQLIPNGHALEQTSIPPPTYTCRFYFLNCGYTSTDERAWKEHNLSHFRGHVPPRSNTCPLCDMTFNIPEAHVSWAANMSHLAQHFRDREDVLARWRPEFLLYRHLWAKRIVGDVEYQELVAGSSLSYGMATYVTLEGRRERREKNVFLITQSRI